MYPYTINLLKEVSERLTSLAWKIYLNQFDETNNKLLHSADCLWHYENTTTAVNSTSFTYFKMRYSYEC